MTRTERILLSALYGLIAVLIGVWLSGMEVNRAAASALSVEVPIHRGALASDIIRACHQRGAEVTVSHTETEYQFHCGETQ